MWGADIRATERHQHHLREAEQRRLARLVTGNRPNLFRQAWNAVKSRRVVKPVEEADFQDVSGIYTTQEVRSLLS